MEKTIAKKPSLADLKAKAGKAFLDMNAVSGGLLADCHPISLPPITVPPIRTDNV